MRNLSTWIARGAFGCLTVVSSYAAVLSSQQPAAVVRQQTVEDQQRDRVVQLGDRLATIEGKLDVMEKLDIGLIIAMGGQLLHLALTKKRQ